MIGIRTFSTRAKPRQAVVVRLMAFVVAGASAVLIPSELAAAAAGHVATGTAFAVVGVASALTLAMIAAARGVDPLRN